MWTIFIGPRSSAKSKMFCIIISSLLDTPSFILPRIAGEERGGGIAQRRLPIVINRGLDMRDGFSVALGFEEMAKTPLAFKVFFHGLKFARDIGVRYCAVNRLFQRPDTGLDRKPRNLD